MGETYKRNIKYQYYKVVLLHKGEDGEWKKECDFNIADWLAKLDEEGLINRKIELSDCIANVENVFRDKKKNIYIIRFFKLRDINIPSKIKDGEKSQAIPLDDDEYIGEDITMLYDRNSGVCMVQNNRMSLSVNKLQEWMNNSVEDDYFVSFRPIFKKTTKDTFRGKQIRAIDITFANVEQETSVRSLSQIIGGIKKFNGISGHITIGVGRSKEKELDLPSTLDLIEELNENRDIISGAKVKMRDGDKARIELIDIFDDLIHDIISFDIEKKQPLNFEQSRMKILSKYLERKDEIVGLLEGR